jgi:hypothetical protein
VRGSSRSRAGAVEQDVRPRRPGPIAAKEIIGKPGRRAEGPVEEGSSNKKSVVKILCSFLTGGSAGCTCGFWPGPPDRSAG